MWALTAAAIFALATESGADTSRGQAAAPLDVEEWLGPDAYPAEAVRFSEQGRVVVALSIDERGKPVDCRNVSQSGAPILDRETCAIVLANGRFTPARDKRGRAIASRYVLPVRWKLPVFNGPFPSGPIAMLQEATIGPDDRVVSCTAQLDGVEQVVRADECSGPARVLSGIREKLKLEGGYRLRAEHIVRHGDAPPPLPPLADGGRLIRATEERQVVDADGHPSACTVKVTGDEAEAAREILGANVCDREARFEPPLGKDGKPATQHVLVYIRYTVLRPAN